MSGRANKKGISLSSVFALSSRAFAAIMFQLLVPILDMPLAALNDQNRSLPDNTSHLDAYTDRRRQHEQTPPI